MATKKVTSSFVDVYKVKGETIKIAFNNLKTERGFSNHHLEIEEERLLNSDSINNGEIYKHSRKLHSKFINGELSEYTIKGALYNHKPIIKDDTRLIMHNIILRGTKQWETVNSYRTDSGEEIYHDTETKDVAIVKAKELALEKNKTVNVIVSKKLVGMDGIIAIAEFLPVTCADDSNVYVFWVFNTYVEEIEEEALFESETYKDSAGQLTIKEDLFSYEGRKLIQ